MNWFPLKNGQRVVGSRTLQSIAKEFGTPCYVYSKEALQALWGSFDTAFHNVPHQINYAVKANSNPAVLKTFAELSSGFDIVSGGELAQVLAAGANPTQIIFSGVGKKPSEIEQALKAGKACIQCLNVESESELKQIESIAKRLQCQAPISFRVNPDVDPNSHPYISTGTASHKFGIPIDAILPLWHWVKNSEYLKLQGIGFHIGSQITSLVPFEQAIDKLLNLIEQLFGAGAKAGTDLTHINVGGGLGVRYHSETIPLVKEYVEFICNKLQKYSEQGIQIIIEPGRAVTAEAGVLLTEVLYLKEIQNEGTKKQFAIMDAGMNDFLRPALYNAWHEILPIVPNGDLQPVLTDVVGPVCETGDFLGKDRLLAIQEGDILAICNAGAYGFSMSSNYNGRPKPIEVFVDGDRTWRN